MMEEFHINSFLSLRLVAEETRIYVAHYTKEQLTRKLKTLENESEELRKKWNIIRVDERTQRKARISNRADSVARYKLLIQDALKSLEKRQIVEDKKVDCRKKTQAHIK